LVGSALIALLPLTGTVGPCSYHVFIVQKEASSTDTNLTARFRRSTPYAHPTHPSRPSATYAHTTLPCPVMFRPVTQPPHTPRYHMHALLGIRHATGYLNITHWRWRDKRVRILCTCIVYWPVPCQQHRRHPQRTHKRLITDERSKMEIKLILDPHSNAPSRVK
jgi:hypothetical protein